MGLNGTKWEQTGLTRAKKRPNRIKPIHTWPIRPNESNWGQTGPNGDQQGRWAQMGPNRAFLISLIPYPLSLIACAFPLYFLSLVLYPSFSILYPILFNLYPIPYSLSIIPYALPYISYFLFLIRYPLYFIQSHIISPFSIKDHWVAIWHVTRPSVWGISKRAKCPCVLSLWVCGVLRCFGTKIFLICHPSKTFVYYQQGKWQVVIKS